MVRLTLRGAMLATLLHAACQPAIARAADASAGTAPAPVVAAATPAQAPAASAPSGAPAVSADTTQRPPGGPGSRLEAEPKPAPPVSVPQSGIAPAAASATTPGKPALGDGTPDSVTAVLNQPAIEDIPLQMNSDVLHYVEYFTGSGRSTFERWLKRSGRYMELFRTVLQREGLPPDLVHLVFVESGFNLNARSYASAVGPWQFMRASAKLFGLNVSQWVDERKDPEKATVAAARYLKHLYGIFGDWPLAIASYNAGEGTVLRAIKAQGTTNYWDLKLPRQTEQYVPQFMAAMAITRDPVKYGFSEVEFDDPMKFDEVSLRGAVDLRALARLCDCTVEDLRTLNPAYRGVSAQGANGVTTLRVPEGKSAVLQQNLANGQRLPAVALTVRHRVQRKETLASIAAEYGVNARRLAAANGVGRHHPLRRGMLLTIPASAAPAMPVLITSNEDPRASTSYVPPRKIGLPAKINGNSDAIDRVNHIVKKGETLASIAAEYDVTPEQVQQWNHLKTTTLRRGQRLRVHSPEDVALTEAAAVSDSAQIAALHVRPAKAKGRHHHGSSSVASGRRHTVRSGETLGEIARKYGVSVNSLKRANGMRGSSVRSGQRLRVPGA